MRSRFPFIKQPNQMDCGPVCLQMVAKYYGKKWSLDRLRELSETTRQGSNLHFLARAAEKCGFTTLNVRVSLDKLIQQAPLPAILHFDQNHFVVLYKVKGDKFYLADPNIGKIVLRKEEFMRRWTGIEGNGVDGNGIALLLEPATETSFEGSEKQANREHRGWGMLSQYASRYRQLLLQLTLGMMAGSVIQMLIPFITQSVVDIGIQGNDLEFIYILLIAQVALFLGNVAIGFFRSYLLLQISTRINISLISDFFIKLMKLPIAYFDAQMTGDILKRIDDHRRIERLLTGSSLPTLFSLFNLIVFGAVLAYYNLLIFGIFLTGSLLNMIWISVFLRRRRELDHENFAESSKEHSKVIELITGMQEIKLHNAERSMRWSWESIQARKFKLDLRSLSLDQTQSIGGRILNEGKDILITFIAASLVISGDLSLGMMLAITYIIGSLSAPVAQLVTFIHNLQDARISLARLREIHEKDDEEPTPATLNSNFDSNQSLELQDVSFRFPGELKPVLYNLNLHIPVGKVTAIVGPSGSGKTTLMKTLLKFYTPQSGRILLGGTDLSTLSHRTWRRATGAVMQEGFVFNDTIARNIAVGQAKINAEKLQHAIQVANLKDYLDLLPQGVQTQIGNEGKGLSSGQKQRILIARAVYKDPRILFFDEATNSLDANNEKIIMENLQEFFAGRTVVVIAHRLSTVRHADQIVVMQEGRIVESGDHDELVELGGKYHHLIQNQLDLERVGA